MANIQENRIVKTRISTPTELRRLDGRTFHANGTPANGAKRYWKCSTPYCTATAWSLKHERTHKLYPLNPNHIETVCTRDGMDEVHAMRRWLQTKLENATKWYELDTLYQKAADRYEDGAAKLPYEQIKPSMKVWRRLQFPRCPRSMAEFSEQLQRGDYQVLLKHENFTIETHPVTDSKNDLHIVFYNRQLILKYLQHITHMFIDGTFATKPKNITDCMQVLTVLVEYMTKAVCIFYALMSRRTTEAYEAVFSHLKEVCPFLKLLVAMMDFEQPMRKGVSRVFDGVQIAGCNVHFDRANYRHLKPIRELIKNDEQVAYWVKRLLVLAFLPPEKIVEQFERLKEIMPKPVRIILNSHLDYFDRQWLRTVTPAGITVYGLLKYTNNCSESFNAMLLNEFGPGPVPADWLWHLMQISKKIDRGIKQRLNLKLNAELPSLVSEYRRVNLKEAWTKYEQAARNGPDDKIDELIETLVSLKENLKEKLRVALLQPEHEYPEESTEAPAIVFEQNPDFDPEIKIDPFIIRQAKARERAQIQIAKLQENDVPGVPHFYQNRGKRAPVQHEDLPKWRLKPVQQRARRPLGLYNEQNRLPASKNRNIQVQENGGNLRQSPSTQDSDVPFKRYKRVQVLSSSDDDDEFDYSADKSVAQAEHSGAKITQSHPQNSSSRSPAKPASTNLTNFMANHPSFDCNRPQTVNEADSQAVFQSRNQQDHTDEEAVASEVESADNNDPDDLENYSVLRPAISIKVGNPIEEGNDYVADESQQLRVPAFRFNKDVGPSNDGQADSTVEESQSRVQKEGCLNKKQYRREDLRNNMASGGVFNLDNFNSDDDNTDQVMWDYSVPLLISKSPQPGAHGTPHGVEPAQSIVAVTTDMPAPVVPLLAPNAADSNKMQGNVANANTEASIGITSAKVNVAAAAIVAPIPVVVPPPANDVMDNSNGRKVLKRSRGNNKRRKKQWLAKEAANASKSIPSMSGDPENSAKA